jgi:hypothetical protein
MILKRIGLASCLFFIPFSAYSQQTSIQNPQAVGLAMRAISALTGTTQVQDVTLIGIATRTAGSDIESGGVTLRALGTTEARSDLSLTSGALTEMRNSSNGSPQGFWIGIDGTVHSMASQNCLTDAAWFFPALTGLFQTSNPNLSITYVGQEIKNGVSVQHLIFVYSAAQTPGIGEPVAGLSSTDVYLDSSSLLPVAFAFNLHPDSSALTNIAVEVDFSSYQTVNGVQIPFHIQKFMNGTLFLDVTVQSAILNSGLTDAAFSPN